MNKETPALFTLQSIYKTYWIGTTPLHALFDISFNIPVGKTIGIVGESGSGKSTLARVLLKLEDCDSGHIFFKDQDITKTRGKTLRALRKHFQMIFQDPDSSLNPRMTAFQHLIEAKSAHCTIKKQEEITEAKKLLELVQLPSSVLNKYPFELSGGQKQRLCIARALSVEPDLIVCDEPLASLDVSIRAQILELLKEIQEVKNISYLFITHDLSTLRYIAHEIIVLHKGHIVEQAPTDRLYENPLHPYTQALLSAIPIADPSIEKNKARHVLTYESRYERKLSLQEKEPCHFVACES